MGLHRWKYRRNQMAEVVDKYAGIDVKAVPCAKELQDYLMCLAQVQAQQKEILGACRDGEYLLTGCMMRAEMDTELMQRKLMRKSLIGSLLKIANRRA